MYHFLETKLPVELRAIIFTYLPFQYNNTYFSDLGELFWGYMVESKPKHYAFVEDNEQFLYNYEDKVYFLPMYQHDNSLTSRTYGEIHSMKLPEPELIREYRVFRDAMACVYKDVVEIDKELSCIVYIVSQG